MEQPVAPNAALSGLLSQFPSIFFLSSKQIPCQNSVKLLAFHQSQYFISSFLVFSSITLFYCKFPYLIFPSVILPGLAFPFIHHHPCISSLFFSLFLHYSCSMYVPPNPTLLAFTGTSKAAWIFVFQLVQLQKKLQVLHFQNVHQDIAVPSIPVWGQHVYIKRRKLTFYKFSEINACML